jgi:serine/threonine-protein kinase
MPIESVAELMSLLDRYGVVDPQARPQLAQVAQEGPKEPRAFAGELLRRGLLTPYQINQLFQGNGPSLQLGAYTVLERLGSGGMGHIFKARHQKLGRIVAVKVIQREKLHRPAVVKRFLREIRVAAQLDHPNIVHAYDAEEVNGNRVLVMEYVEGTDLGKLIKEGGPLPVRAACDYIRQAALALQHASAKGLVHRDIKPGNLMLQGGGAGGGFGTVKLLDLGLARLREPTLDGKSSGALTVAGKLVGTVDFIAPEQARDARHVDIRADVYSLGCTFYYLLTGQPPFEGATLTNKLFKHALEEPRPLEEVRPEVPQTVAAVVRTMMAKRPEDRYQTPADVAAALDAVLQGRAPPLAPVAARNERPAAAPKKSRKRSRAARRRSGAVPIPARAPAERRRLWLYVILLIALLVAFALLVLLLPEYLGTSARADQRPSPDGPLLSLLTCRSYPRNPSAPACRCSSPASPALQATTPCTTFSGATRARSSAPVRTRPPASRARASSPSTRRTPAACGTCSPHTASAVC